jgi:hypothetical protein
VITTSKRSVPALPGCCAPVSAPHRPDTNPALLLLGAAGTVADAAAAFKLLEDENDGSSQVLADVALEVDVEVRVLSSSATCSDLTLTSVSKHHPVCYVMQCCYKFNSMCIC